MVAAAEVGRAHAADAVQQAAMTALGQLDRFQRGSDFRAWMAAVVRGAARNMRRSEQARARRERTPRLIATTSDMDSPDPAGLYEALDALPAMQRECMLLRAVGGHTYTEVGAIVGVPEATARSHVYRARRALLGRLDGAGTTEDA